MTSGTIPNAYQNDSGWKTITNSSVFSGTIYYRKVGKFVELFGNSIGMKGTVGTSGYTLGTLDSGYRPSENRATAAGGTSAWGFLLVNSSGSIVFYKRPSDSGWSGNINFAITFMLG